MGFGAVERLTATQRRRVNLFEIIYAMAAIESKTQLQWGGSSFRELIAAQHSSM
jgi:hypothetical protein